MLTLVGTPIGNLGDFSARGVAALREAEVIACEDTRRARVLLNHFGITGKKLLAHHAANEYKSAPGLVKLMLEGTRLCYFSDGGMPGISDPGYLLVKEALAAGIEVEAVGGVTAVTLAVARSGVPAARFTFAGFLPRKKSEMTRVFQQFLAQDLATALVFYESPQRLAKTFDVLAELCPEVPCAVGRELTKVHETWLRGTVAEVAAQVKNGVKGEVTVVLGRFTEGDVTKK